MRSRRANALPVGDPKADSLVPSVWQPIMRDAVRRLTVGDGLLIDAAPPQIPIAALRTNPAVNPATARINGGQPELGWVLHQIDRRFVAAGPRTRSDRFDRGAVDAPNRRRPRRRRSDSPRAPGEHDVVSREPADGGRALEHALDESGGAAHAAA